jgi:hypothetical protein
MEGGQSELTTNQGFFGYVFNFDNENKGLMLNFLQYSFLAVPFVIIILKLVNYYTPEENDEKGTLEILLEIFGSLTVILFSIWFINKIIRYIPTYSQVDYSTFNETNFMIPMLILLFTMQTKLGNKLNILIERLFDLYDGKTNLKDKDKDKKKKDYKTTQPITHPGHQPSRADFIQNSHARGQTEGQYTKEVHHQAAQPQHNFNNAYAGPVTPLMDAAEPMAANEAFGGSMFGGSAF